MRMGCIHDVLDAKAAAHTSNDFGDEIYDIITEPERTAYPYSWVHVLALYAWHCTHTETNPAAIANVCVY